MNTTQNMKQALTDGAMDKQLRALYISDEAVQAQRTRYARLLDTHAQLFGAQESIDFFSAPGRTEIGGNHTDHNHGCVLAASINLDAVAAVSAREDGIACIHSENYGMHEVSVTQLDALPQERDSSVAILRGMLAGFARRGCRIGGFSAAVTSDVLSGSGLSSSASYEVLLGTVLNHLYNDGKISPVEIAQISQWAENEYFGKPCGLMDQTASAVGSCVTIDFENTAQPKFGQVELDLASYGYALCIVDTGGHHADLTPEYAAIKQEMQAVAAQLGGTVLRETDESVFQDKIPVLREKLGDRAVLRAMHFYEENRRVEKEVTAIREGRFADFLTLVNESGASSYMYNQNIYASSNPKDQSVAVGLALSEQLLRGRGAWRVHGGGFAGTIQAFVPLDALAAYQTKIETVFGRGHCYVLSIRAAGGVKVM